VAGASFAAGAALAAARFGAWANEGVATRAAKAKGNIFFKRKQVRLRSGKDTALA
jgi:hypothetical protein